MTDRTLVPIRGEVLRPAGRTAGGVWLLRAEGVIDSADHPVMRATTRSPTDLPTVAVDLSLVHLLSASGMSGLLACAQQLADDGRALYVSGANPTVQRVLDLTATGRITVVPTVADVLADRATEAADTDLTAPAAALAVAPARPSAVAVAARTPDADAQLRELVELRAEARDLRARARAHPLVDRAVGVLMERYRLPGPDAGFALLKSSSQRHNVKVRSLAAAVVTGPRPQDGARAWFPTRVRQEPREAPRLGFLPDVRPDQVNRGRVVEAVLRRAMEISSAARGDVRLLDPYVRGLRLEKHQGLDDDFREVFEHVEEDDPVACALAVRRLARITVSDVASDPLFTDDARAILLAAGSRGVHSTPLTSGRQRCVGVVSTYLDRPAEPLTAAQARALDELADQAGQWLRWHQTTVLLDALEELHREALSGAARHTPV